MKKCKRGDAHAALRQRDELQSEIVGIAARLMKLGEQPAGKGKPLRQEVSDLLFEYSYIEVLAEILADADRMADDVDVAESEEGPEVRRVARALEVALAAIRAGK